MQLRVLAPAKVNLYLRVLGRRQDGYHELITLMQPVDLCDELVISREGQGLRFTCDDPSLQRDNLVERAARAWFQAAALRPRVHLHLVKRVPVGAGLGGGSSDAAATLLGLNALYDGLLSPQRLYELACGLGSDVPFFLGGVTALCRGRGEVVEPWPEFPLLDYVLVNPGFRVSTAWVYDQLDLPWTKLPEVNRIYRLQSQCGPLPAGLLANDLAEVTKRAHPEVGELEGALAACGALGSLMSGSGPTVFGVFADQESARRAARRLGRRRGWWVRACRGIQA